MKDKNILSVLMIITAASGWGIIGVFTRPLSGFGFSPFQITFLRSIIVVILMGLFLLIKNKSLLHIKIKDVWIFLGNGLLSIVFFNVCYFITINNSTLATASILLYTAPCFVVIMSAVFFKEKITLQKLAALVLAFIGCIATSGFTGGEISLFAFLTGIGAGLGYAAYSIFGKAALKKYHTFTFLFYTFTVSSIGLLPFAKIGNISRSLVTQPQCISPILGLGIIATFLPYILYTKGLKKVEAGKASILAFAEPMVAAAAGIIIFHEPFGIKNIVGILLIFLAIVLLNFTFDINLKKK